MTNDAVLNHQWEKRHEILERIEITIRYHQKRERFFEVSDKWVKAFAIVGSTVAFANLAGDGLVRRTAAAAIAITTTLSLVFGFTERTKKHAELARKFRELEARIRGRGETQFGETELASWEQEERMLEASEPPALNTLVVICQNEIFVAAGKLDRVVPIPWYKRVVSQFLSLEPKMAEK